MPRNKKNRTVKCNPTAYYFKPRAIPLSALEEIVLEIDELESLRLADYLANSHEQAAAQMKISRATFGRIVEIARNKVVDAILHGKAIKIANDFPAELMEKRGIKCACYDSTHKNNSKNDTCPKGKKTNKEN